MMICFEKVDTPYRGLYLIWSNRLVTYFSSTDRAFSEKSRAKMNTVPLNSADFAIK